MTTYPTSDYPDIAGYPRPYHQIRLQSFWSNGLLDICGGIPAYPPRLDAVHGTGVPCLRVKEMEAGQRHW